MLHIKSQGQGPSGSERIFKGFSLPYMDVARWSSLASDLLIIRSPHMKFEFKWPYGL